MRGRGLLLIVVAAAAFGAAGGIAVPAPDDPAADRAVQLVYQLADERAGPAAADALVDLGAAAVPALVAALGDASVRDSAFTVIERMGPRAKDAVPALVVIVQDAASPMRRAAVHALGVIGADAAPAFPALTALVGDAKSKLQSDAADTIARIAHDIAVRAVPRSPVEDSVQKAIDGGIDWLGRHQSPDGSWSGEKFTERCAEKPPCGGAGRNSHDPGVTGLALLAHFAAGETPSRGHRRAAVKAGLAWLVKQQRADGLLSDEERTDRAMYEHGCAGLALAEGYRLTKLPEYADPVRRAVQFVEASQNPDWGWRYDTRPKSDNDTSVTAWMTRILVSASEAGIEVKPAAFRGALAWVDAMTEPELGRTGYQQRGGPSSRFQAAVDRYPAQHSEALTAAGLLIRAACGHDASNDALFAKGVTLVASNPPRWSPGEGAVDFYYWMHGSEAMRRAGGAARITWNRALASALLAGQVPPARGCARGSWDPNDPWGAVAGRVYSTSLAVIALGDWTPDPPEKKPPAPPAFRQIGWALEKALKSPDDAVRKAAQRALDVLRGEFTAK